MKAKSKQPNSIGRPAKPLVKSDKFIDRECYIDRYTFLCPNCNHLYHADIALSVFYDEDINRIKECVIPTYEYKCPICRDYAFQVDDKIAESVMILRQHGFETVASCSGHPYDQRRYQFGNYDDAIHIDANHVTYGPFISFNIPAIDNTVLLEDMKCMTAERKANMADSIKRHNAALYTMNHIRSSDVLILEYEDGENYFITAPVDDVTKYRQSGTASREIMLDRANYKMTTFVKRIVRLYEKKYDELMKGENNDG